MLNIPGFLSKISVLHWTRIKREERVCQLCVLKDIEDEYHFHFICPLCSTLRTRYIPEYYCGNPNFFKFKSRKRIAYFYTKKCICAFIMQWDRGTILCHRLLCSESTVGLWSSSVRKRRNHIERASELVSESVRLNQCGSENDLSLLEWRSIWKNFLIALTVWNPYTWAMA